MNQTTAAEATAADMEIPPPPHPQEPEELNVAGGGGCRDKRHDSPACWCMGRFCSIRDATTAQQGLPGQHQTGILTFSREGRRATRIQLAKLNVMRKGTSA